MITDYKVWTKVDGVWMLDEKQSYGTVYYEDANTSEVKTVDIIGPREFGSICSSSYDWYAALGMGSVTVSSQGDNHIVGVELNDNITTIPNGFLFGCTFLNMSLDIPNSVESIGDSFLTGCTSFNQPIVLPDGLESIGSNFLAGCTSFNQPIELSYTIKTIGYNFLNGCELFNNQLVMPSELSRIEFAFMHGCTSFNSRLVLPSGLEYIEYAFMSGCSSFNQEINIPYGVKEIGGLPTQPTGFMGRCSSFNQPIKIPDSVVSIGDCFMSDCLSFNQDITLSNSLESIGYGFLLYCPSFNKPVTIPSSVTSLGTSFMYQCESFNQPLTNNAAITYISARFLGECTSFNQPLVIPESVTSINEDFLTGCTAFNQTLTFPDTITSISASFMSGCTSYAKPLKLPAGLTALGKNFMYNCKSFAGEDNYLDVGTMYPDATIEGVLSTDDSAAPMYTTGVYIKGNNFDRWTSALPNRTSSPYRKLVEWKEPIVEDWGYITYWDGTSTTAYKRLDMTSQADWNKLGGSSSWSSATINGVTVTKSGSNAIRTVQIGADVASLPNYFLSGCTKMYNSVYSVGLAYPNALGTIGSHFMDGCTNYTGGVLLLSSTITSVGDYFLYNCNNIATSTYGVIYINSRFLNAMASSNYSFATSSSTAKSYTSGIKITSTYYSAALAKFPNRTSSPYRKLISD